MIRVYFVWLSVLFVVLVVVVNGLIYRKRIGARVCDLTFEDYSVVDVETHLKTQIFGVLLF